MRVEKSGNDRAKVESRVMDRLREPPEPELPCKAVERRAGTQFPPARDCATAAHENAMEIEGHRGATMASREQPDKRRNLAAWWFLGLLNNSGKGNNLLYPTM